MVWCEVYCGVRCSVVRHGDVCDASFHVGIISTVTVLHAETFYIVVEFASGGSLLSVLKEKRHNGALLPWQTRLDYGLQIAKGMSYLASKQVG